jgi:hypothetical protein
MTKLRVLVLEERAGTDGPKVWVAQALEEDMATQVAPDETPLAAVAALGDLFDIRDAVVAQERSNGADVAALPITPAWYHTAWERGAPLGEYALGASRVAEVRAWTA